MPHSARSQNDPGDDNTHQAFGHPGLPPNWTSSRKSGVGTAYSPGSPVWFTLSSGILNEVYYPTVDRPQVRDMQFLISDGRTFFHEEKRDLQHQLTPLGDAVLGYRIESADPQGRYRIIKKIFTVPDRPCLLVQARLEAQPEWADRLSLYALLAPHLECAEYCNSARKYEIAGKKLLIAWKEPIWLALGCSVPFLKRSCGFSGTSDGWQDLHANRQMDWTFDCALNGNVAVTAQIDWRARPEFTLGLAFGEGLHAAATALIQCLSEPTHHHCEKYIRQWQAPVKHLMPLARESGDQGALYRSSHQVLLAHEDKTFRGAFIASLSIPWGEAKGEKDLGGYHLVWTRDMVNAAMALLATGNLNAPRWALSYLACAQQADGGFSQNFWVDGTPYWTGIQLDEVAHPVLLAWHLWQVNGLAHFDPYPMVRAAAAYLVREGPATQQERWEEASGYSPSTLAVVIAALIGAAQMAREKKEEKLAVFLEEYADFIESHMEQWTVTTCGELLPGVPKYYIRICPAAFGDPHPNEDPNTALLRLRNQPPGARQDYPARNIVDTGFLALVRYGVRPAADPIIADTVRVIDAVLKVDTQYGPSWHRYNHDGYGNRADGGPYQGWGKGRAWPLLTGQRGHYELAAGHDVGIYVKAMERFAGAHHLLPEQVWDVEDPEHGMALGQPTGAAMPLVWAHAEYIKLLRSLKEGRPVDLIPAVAARYQGHKGRRDLEIWKSMRQVQRIRPGQTLRIQCPARFQLVWTDDEWQHVQKTEAQGCGLSVYFVDIPIRQQQSCPIQFTFYWLENVDYPFITACKNQWQGHNFSVTIAK